MRLIIAVWEDVESENEGQYGNRKETKGKHSCEAEDSYKVQNIAEKEGL